MSLALLIVSLSTEAEMDEWKNVRVTELVIKIHGVMQYKLRPSENKRGWKKDEWTNELNDLNESMN